MEDKELDGEEYYEDEVGTEELAWIAYMMINTNVRMYDVLISIFSVLGGSEKAKALQELHEAGGYLFPPPYLEQDGEN
jgi:hypothetical protein